MKTIKFEKLKMDFRQGYWFSAEYSVNGVVKLGEGCHFSDKARVAEIKAKFEAMLKYAASGSLEE